MRVNYWLFDMKNPFLKNKNQTPVLHFINVAFIRRLDFSDYFGAFDSTGETASCALFILYTTLFVKCQYNSVKCEFFKYHSFDFKNPDS